MSTEDSITLGRRSEESALSHHKRLVFGKLVDKTLADYDYAELGTYLYDKEYSGDAVRKMMYGSCKTLQLMDAETYQNTPATMKSETESLLLELQKERQRFFDQRREYNKMVSESGRMEHLEDRLVEAAANLGHVIGTPFTRLTERTNVQGYTEAVLVLCDWHYGMVTDNAWNTYNTEICKQRVSKVVDDAITRITMNGCHKLHIVILGDAIHGGIHCSARVASNELVCDQIMQVSELLAQCIAELSRYVIETVVHVTYGNHARTIQNKHDSIHRDNMERLIPWWLKERLSGLDSVTIMPESENEFIYFDACGLGFCATHGDLDSVRNSPRLLTTLFQKKYGKNVDCILLADKHHRESFEELGVFAAIVGSLCGTDDYANGKRLYSTPEQLLMIVNPADGIDATYHLKCG